MDVPSLQLHAIAHPVLGTRWTSCTSLSTRPFLVACMDLTSLITLTAQEETGTFCRITLFLESLFLH